MKFFYLITIIYTSGKVIASVSKPNKLAEIQQDNVSGPRDFAG
jgi:hypothetical protein